MTKNDVLKRDRNRHYISADYYQVNC